MIHHRKTNLTQHWKFLIYSPVHVADILTLCGSLAACFAWSDSSLLLSVWTEFWNNKNPRHRARCSTCDWLCARVFVDVVLLMVMSASCCLFRHSTSCRPRTKQARYCCVPGSILHCPTLLTRTTSVSDGNRGVWKTNVWPQCAVQESVVVTDRCNGYWMTACLTDQSRMVNRNCQHWLPWKGRENVLIDRKGVGRCSCYLEMSGARYIRPFSHLAEIARLWTC